MQRDILNFFQSINKGYIHPKGKKATEILLNELDPSDGEKILELGFGTGTSLIHTFSRNQSIKLFGVEASDLMLKRATSRIKFCGLKEKITLALIEEDMKIPFPSDYFDKIYVESVLAIQEEESLKTMLLELNRVLKPMGILCINELLWNSQVSKEKIKATNLFVKEHFGIIQANGMYPYLSNWNDLLEENNFRIAKSFNLNEDCARNSIKGSETTALLLSRIYSFIGKCKSKIIMHFRKEWNSYKIEMKNIDSQITLDPYFLKIIKTN